MQSALLDYLRNLTPQILLLSLGLVLGTKLDLHRPDLSWAAIKSTAPFILIIGTFLIAFIANLFLFLERMLETSEKLEIESTRAARAGTTHLLRKLLPLVWQHDKPLVAKIAISLFVVFAASLAVFMSAIPAAVSVLKAVAGSS